MSLRGAYRQLCLSQTQQNLFIEQFSPKKQIYGCTHPECLFYAKISPNTLNYEVIRAHTCVALAEPSVPLSFKPEDEVMLTFSFDELFLVKLVPGATFQNRYGAFSYDQIIGKGPGQKIISTNGKAHCFALTATPNLSAFSLTRQTQILFYYDAAFVCYFVCPGFNVAEAGVGSGAVSVRLLERVAQGGRLFGYDVDDTRVEAVGKKLAQWRDYFAINAEFAIYKHDVSQGFLGVAPQSLDFVFLDLPEPKNCIDALCASMRYGATFVVFLPCLEQIHDFVGAGRDRVFVRKIVKISAGGYEYEARTLPASLVRRQFKGSKDSEKFEFLREVQQQRTHTGFLCVCSVCFSEGIHE